MEVKQKIVYLVSCNICRTYCTKHLVIHHRLTTEVWDRMQLHVWGKNVWNQRLCLIWHTQKATEYTQVQTVSERARHIENVNALWITYTFPKLSTQHYNRAHFLSIYKTWSPSKSYSNSVELTTSGIFNISWPTAPRECRLALLNVSSLQPIFQVNSK